MDNRRIYCRYEMCVNLMQNKIKIENLFHFLLFIQNSIFVPFWNKRTKKIYDPLQTARLHENGEEKDRTEKEKCAKTMNCERRNEETNRWPCAVCFGRIFLFFYFSKKKRKIEPIVNGQNNRQFRAIYYYRRMFGMHLDCTTYNMAFCSRRCCCCYRRRRRRRRRQQHTKSNDTTRQTVVSSFSMCTTLCADDCVWMCLALADPMRFHNFFGTKIINLFGFLHKWKERQTKWNDMRYENWKENGNERKQYAHCRTGPDRIDTEEKK